MLLMPRADHVQKSVYGVPHRFGIGSIMMITVAFALVFAAMRLMGFGLSGVLGTSVFLMAVGLAQSLHAEKPREASTTCGLLVFPAIVVVATVWERRFIDHFAANLIFAIVLYISLMPAGLLVGYFAGLLLATVFMFTDMATSVAIWRNVDESSEAVIVPPVAEQTKPDDPPQIL